VNQNEREQIEAISDSLKGVASILQKMSYTNDAYMWNDYALHLLFEKVSDCVEELDSACGEK